jgi:two-component system sensor histidine kinase ChvG
MRFGLRTKLALISLLLLFIPLAGLRISEMIKEDLLKSREQALLFSARAVASTLSGRSGLFDTDLFHNLNSSRDLYLYRLSTPIRLNGKTDDWQAHLKQSSRFGREHLLYASAPYDESSFAFTHLTGVRGEYLYALFLVTDENIVYRKPDSLRLDLSDHLQISVEDRQGRLHKYLLTPIQPGWVNGFAVPYHNAATISAKYQPQIQGMWSESQDGYILEIRLPMSMVGQKLAFAITDIDDPENRSKKYVIGTSTPGNTAELGWLLSPAENIGAVLKSLDRPNSRVLIVDYNRRIRASHGHLADQQSEQTSQQSLLGRISNITYSLFSPLYRLFTTPFTSTFDQSPPQLSTLDLKGVSEALLGKASVTRYSPGESGVEIMAAITPLQKEDEVVGAVIVEQTTNSILALQNRVIEESITLTILIFFSGGIGLLLFASRLSARIRRLGRDAASAISANGRITPNIHNLEAGDELGELARTLNTILNQLKIQGEFQEKMADNLEHEMRTPLAGISASLKNLAGELSEPQAHIQEYLNWALEDVSRLESLLTTIRDATSLQGLIDLDQQEKFELNSAVGMWLHHSWRPAFEGVEFIYHQPQQPLLFFGDPARIHQMLDKLVENAVSFHTPASPITITVGRSERNSAEVEMSVSNQGPAIEEQFRSQIFTSMVSRRATKGSRPHLGLGLYIVRTIAEHHRGRVEVAVDELQQLTTFTVTLPLMIQNPKNT